MSKITKQPISGKTGTGSVSGMKFEMALHKENYILLAVAFVIIVIGFLLMTGASNSDPEVFNEEIYGFRRRTLAPMVALFGFIFAICAIMKRPSIDKK